MATLYEFPVPAELHGMTTAEVITSRRKHMKRAGGTKGLQKAAQLIASLITKSPTKSIQMACRAVICS
jgi:hypothetical protein